MTLAKIIEELKKIQADQPDLTVSFGFCGAFPILKGGSSRCFYERFAIDWAVRRKGEESKHNPSTVTKLLAFLQSAIGTRIEGYKGGIYTVNEYLPLHVDGYGECTSTFVSGVVNRGYEVVLVTEHGQ